MLFVDKFWYDYKIYDNLSIKNECRYDLKKKKLFCNNTDDIFKVY